MQPQTTIPLKAGDSATLEILDWQIKYGYFGNNPTIEASELAIDEFGTETWRQRTDFTDYRYKSGSKLNRVRLIFGPSPLTTDINVTIK